MNGLQCNLPQTGHTGLNVAESLSIIRDICQDVSRMSSGDGYSTLAKTALGDSSMKLSITTTENSACDEATTTELLINQKTCEQELYQIVDTCSSASSDPVSFYGGSATRQCAVYSITPELEEIIRCGGNPSSRATDMDPKHIEKAIDEYCSQSFELSPAPQQILTFMTTVPPGQSYHNYLSDGILIRATAQFSDQAQHDCAESKAFDTKGDECRRKLKAVYEQCGGEGGGISENGANGCVVWTVWGESLK
ncbi:hypothetical protein M409DRAFT_67633 [Zasmidium cellare ATCC 36951]|uniref:Uncharacterized protein n=1 Tax=Zasmidium cellare ATCC 36951 TaxID=1080233 RepID=A0A6A6CFB3_ZASCE|nr:uncharacterized protein M409DRAFT_67633 [Zasmidium cellare ATCC 36951]KAF2164940.1 hypothetical protein M409DRAFT_67633 [Zasmidium cellare ATCC 36951]